MSGRVVLGIVVGVVGVVNRDNGGRGRRWTLEGKGGGRAGKYELFARKSDVAVVRRTRNWEGERASAGRGSRGLVLKLERRTRPEAGAGTAAGDGWALHHRGCVSGISPRQPPRPTSLTAPSGRADRSDCVNGSVW